MATITPELVKAQGSVDWAVDGHGVTIESWQDTTYRAVPLPAGGDWFKVGTDAWPYAFVLDRGGGPFEAFVTTGEDYDLSASAVEYDDFLEAVRAIVREHYAATTP